MAGHCLLCFNGKLAESAGNGKRESDDPQSLSSMPGTAQSEAIKTISAEKLSAEYGENEVAADGLYLNGIILVKGHIESISKHAFTGEPYVKLAGSGPFSSVICEFSQSKTSLLGALKKGDDITIQGTCIGYEIMDVHLSRCEIIR